MNSNTTVEAEYDTLKQVRVLTPGVEALIGSMDPEANLFLDSFSLEKAQREHQKMVNVLEENGVEVRQLYDDLAGEPMEELIDSHSDIDVDNLPADRQQPVYDEIRDNWADLSPRQQLQTILMKPNLTRHPPKHQTDGGAIKDDRADEISMTLENPITNMFFQRDQQMVGDNGPIMCNMKYPTRQSEVPITKQAWNALDADVYDPISASESIEGGEFIPAGNFALIGVEAENGDVLRTTYDAGKEVLDSGAVSYDEVGLVHAPKETAEKQAEMLANGEADMNIMHLDTWFNIAGEGLAVMNEELASDALVHIYEREESGYTDDPIREVSLTEYLEDQGYEWVDIPAHELPNGANFLTLDDHKVMPIYEAGEDGEYDPELNETIEGMRDFGVEIVPDGIGLELDNLTNGYGGVHCMTTPINRE